MKHLKTIFACLLMVVLSIGQVWAAKITDVANIESGKTYYIGATSSSTDYYLSVSGATASSTAVAGTAITDKSNAATFVFTQSGDNWTIKFSDSNNYLSLSSSKANGKVIVNTSANWTITNNTSKTLLTLACGDTYALQKNNSGTQFGSYAKTQTDVWLEEVVSGGSEEPTLSSISVATTPTKVTYTEGEYFDPTGLVITRNYSSGSPDTYAYADHTSDFSFTPSTSTALTTSNTSVTITYGGKSTTQAITVNAASGGQGGDSGEGITDVLTASNLDATSTTYTDFSNVSATSGAVYAGNSGKSSGGGIQMRSKNSNSGIVSTKSGGTVKSVKITVESGSNTIDVYGSNTAYTAASDLYDSSKQGTKVGSVSATGIVTFTDDYAYVGIRSNNGAIYVTSVEITWIASSGSSAPTLSVSPTTIDFGTVNKGASVESKTVAVTFADLTGSVTYSELSSPFTATGTISQTGDEITIAANTATVGEYSQTLTIQSANDNLSKEVTVKMNVVEPFNGLKLTFDVSSNPGEWPTTNTTTTTNYTYTLDGVGYTFALNNAKSNSGYLMLTAVAKLGLPAISGYKLVKIEASNSGSCSISTQVSVSSSDATKTDVTGGAAQTWSTTSSKYTYNLSGTEENTMYYLWIANKNCQLVELTLYYEEAEAPAVSAPTISGEDNFYASTEVTISVPEGAKVYYTTDGSDPKSGTEYTAPFTLTSTTTVKAIAKINEDYSQVAEKTFTKATVMTVAQARTAIDAGGDLSNKYVKGIISQIDDYNSTYSSITYWISDDGTTTNQLEVYSGLAGVVKDAFTSVDDLKVGEEVTINGTLKKYQSTYEFDKNNTIVAYRSLSPLAWSANAFTAEIGGNNTFPSLSGTTGLTVTYSSSDQTVATISADGTSYDLKKVGETTISASSAETDSYVATTKSYTLTVKAAVVRYSISYEKNGGTSDATDSEGATETNLPNPLPTITKAGMNFGGWYTTSDFQQASKVNGGEELTENTTLYAQWLEPYTIAEALTMIAALEDNAKTSEVYVAGVVTDDDVTIASNTATYYIKDAGASNSLKVYNGKGLNNSNVAAGDIQEDDAVVLYGQLQKYVKNSTITPEVTSSYIYKKTRPTYDVTGVTLPTTANVRSGKTITLTATIAPANASNKNVTWSTSNDAVATVNGGVVTGVAEGTAVITATTEDGGFAATCIVTVAGALPAFTEADHEWIKISNASKLVAGKYYVIASESKGFTAGSISSGHAAHVTTTFDNGVIASADLGSGTLIFELGGITDAWTLTETVSGLTLKEKSTKSIALEGTSATWAIAFSEGNAIIGGESRILDNTANYFTTYSSATSTSMLLPQLYMWAELSHSVTFDANGGVAESVPGVERTDEGKIIIPATEPTHADASKVFAGWYTNEAGTGTKYVAGDEFATSADVTLYAKWASVPTYTVTYVPGGSGTIPAVASYPAGKSVTIATIEDLSNPGYSFTGWTVKDADQNVLSVDEDNKFTMPASNVTITAGWARVSNQKWVLVTSVDELKTDGTEFIIAGAESEVAMGALYGSYYTSLSVAKTGNILKGPESITVVTFETGSESGKFAIKHGDKYICSSSAKTIEEKTTASDWTITISEAGVATMQTAGGYLKYNSGSPRFNTYASGQQAVAIYVKAANKVINDAETADASDIATGADVTVHQGGVLNVDADKQITDLNIENGGKIELSGNTLTITGTFTITATMAGGTSGQITGTTDANIVVDPNADVYFDIKLARNGDPNQWHAFTVPFPVDAINGVFDLDNNKLTNEVNYAIMSYHGDIRANGQYGWKKYRGILQPGTFYLITVDGLRTDYRFKKVAGEPLVADNNLSYTAYTGSGADSDYGWNGLGNPTLAYGKVGFPVQILDPDAYAFVTKIANSTNFIVGTPFFYKAGTTGSMVMDDPDATAYFAPARTTANEVTEIEVAFGNDDFKDNLYISASEDALNSYEYDKDLVKMSMSGTPRVAQIFGMAYGDKLSMVHAPLNNSQASYDITLYAPAAGEYTIAAPNEQDADVYLTLNGDILWNIALSPYTLDLTKGNTEGYGLLLQAKTPHVATGVDNMENSTDVQKVILNEHVYILRNGQCFDVTGKAVR